jgi:hypothetical protein
MLQSSTDDIIKFAIAAAKPILVYRDKEVVLYTFSAFILKL